MQRLERGGRLRLGGVFGRREGEAGDLPIFSETVYGTATAVVVAPTAVATLPFTTVQPTQHAFANFYAQIDGDGATPGTSTVTFTLLFDGIAFDQITQSAATAGGVMTLAFHSLDVTLAPGAHTVSVTVQSNDEGVFAIPAVSSRLTLIVLPG